MNERITENIVRRKLEELGYGNIEEQKSINPRVKKALKNASKTGKGGIGKPEFLIVDPDSDFIIVVECKADIKKHRSEDLDKYKDYALDGVINYVSHLSKEFNVIGIAISGQTEDELKITNIFGSRNTDNSHEILDTNDKGLERLVNFEEYKNLVKRDPNFEQLKLNELISFSREIHSFMHAHAKLSEQEKPLLVSGILIALNNNAFFNSYEYFDQEKELSRELTRAIKSELEKAKIPDKKLDHMTQAYSYIKVHPNLSSKTKEQNDTPLRVIIDNIKNKVEDFISANNSYDLLGQFYGEFLKYTGGDKKGLGIVLTPKHITELFTELVTLTPTTKVLDTCAGTGGFLISAMSKMISKAQSEEEITNIKKDCLYGVELQPNMYALAASNMILRGDGKANLYQGSCFDSKISNKLKKADIDYAFINPPYAQKGEGLHELDFIYHTLNMLKTGGKLIAIVPMSCAIQAHKTKEKLLKKHRLEAVMSMPEDLFYPVGVVTCVMVFEAHTAHNSDENHESWFGYWKNDGHEKTRRFGRADINKSWEDIKQQWIRAFRYKEVIPEFSVRRKVGINDEWCAEAYLETDYSTLNEEDFAAEVKRYALFKLANENLFKNEEEE